MSLAKAINDNLQFLLAETASHLSVLRDYLATTANTPPSRLLDRKGYVENLRLSIHNHCLSEHAAADNQSGSKQLLRAVEDIATHLERITELSREAMLQSLQVEQKRLLKRGKYLPMLERVLRALEMIEPALADKDTRRALKIGRVEQRLDQAYQKQLLSYSKHLKKDKHPADHIALIMLGRSIEQMGNALLRISEAIISAAMGQHFNTDRYHTLNASLTELEAVNQMEGLQVQTIAQTKSGSAINAVASAGEPGYHGVFKDGGKRKLKEEKQRVNDWHEIFPGLAPKILAYKKSGESAAMLIEHLAGQTFEQILLSGSDKLFQECFTHLTETLKQVWDETRTAKPVSANYMDQLAKRMDDVYAIHPEFKQNNMAIGSQKLLSFSKLLTQVQQLESDIQAPFSVYIHGDFNVDNIIYDQQQKRINFIDLHRSRYMDYLQDITVFMVSNYRLQVFDPRVRQRIAIISHGIYRFARGYAKKVKDENFELRLAFGLIRSFVTSTRFILDKSLSRAMFYRALYLMEQLLAANAKPKRRFKVPIEEIFIG
ncbi:MAG: phosphotransferase [Candidatus Thiodiazotropha sp. (ex Ctena orbiculata)]|nr:phosphotransferase [Candidatus Thiodiazotropha taylori]